MALTVYRDHVAPDASDHNAVARAIALTRALGFESTLATAPYVLRDDPLRRLPPILAWALAGEPHPSTGRALALAREVLERMGRYESTFYPVSLGIAAAAPGIDPWLAVGLTRGVGRRSGYENDALEDSVIYRIAAATAAEFRPTIYARGLVLGRAFGQLLADD